MSFRLTTILFGLMLVLAVALVAITLTGDGPDAGDRLLDEFAGVKAEQVDAVEIGREQPTPGKLLFVRVGKDRWEVREPFTARADSRAVEAVVTALLNAKPVASSAVSGDPAQHGLVPPSLRVTLRKGSDASATVNVGDVTIGGESALAFVTTSARPDRPAAVRRSDLDALLRTDSRKDAGKAGAFAKWAADYRTRQLVAPDVRSAADEVTAVKLTRGGKTVALTNAVPGGWSITTPPLGAADVAGAPTPMPGTLTGVRPLLAALTGLQALSPDDFVDAPKDLKEYGLDPAGPDATRAEVTTKAGTDVVFVGKPVAGQPGKVWVKVEGDSGVVRASAANADALAAVVNDPDSIRDRNLLAFDKLRVDAVDVVAGGQTTKLRKAGPTPVWTLFGGPGDPQAANVGHVNALLDPLLEKRTVRLFSPAGDPKNDAFFAPPEVKAEVKIWTDAYDPKADPKAEPALKGPPTTLTFGKVDADGVHVRRVLPGGERADLILPPTLPAGPGQPAANAVEVVTKTRLDFLDPSLKPFATTAVARLAFNRGPEAFEVAKTDVVDPQYPNGRWAFDKPDASKGKAANAGRIEDLVTNLATLTTSRFASEGPTPEELTRWGLDPKDARYVKAVVTLKAGDDKERAYEFGADTPDGNNSYARTPGKPGVFLVSKATASLFRTADLRDPTLVTFDRSRLVGLKLRGWREQNGSVLPVELEKKDGAWAAKTAGYSADPAKVEAFVTALLAAKAKAVVPGGPGKAEFGFGVDVPGQNGLEVTLEMGGGLPNLQVNLGAAADGGASLYAVGNQNPTDVVTVDAAPFKDVKDKRGALAK